MARTASMIRIQFSSAHPRQITAGPAAEFRFDAVGVTARPGDRAVAQFSNRMWQVDGHHFTRCESRESARVQFEDMQGHLTDPLGPFGSLHLYGGSLYAGKMLLARFDERRQIWQASQRKVDYVAIVVRA